MSFWTKLFGNSNEDAIRPFREIVGRINALESSYEQYADEALGGLTMQFKERLQKGETLDDLLPEAFAAVREAAKRKLYQRHFDVQLIGGMALHQGKIAEMRTGEGKTLVATLPLYLNALTGRGVHLVTPNDYLSRIGAGWMGPVYTALGTTVSVIAHDISGIYDPMYNDSQSHGDERLNHFRPVSRNKAYRADIIYGTNNEFGFDYLRDNLEYLPDQLRQREHYFTIVDEIDSILIDEARTPLIISAPDTESADLYKVFARISPQLKADTDYNVDEKLRAVTITEEGIDKIERILGIGNIYEERGLRFVRHLEQALRAQALFQRDRDYVVKNGEVIIVDEFTGRLMPGRRWSEGLHQAVEAREGVEVQQESRTLATITFQNYFRMYEKLAGMTGTAQTSAEEFYKVYKLDVVTIPTHRNMIRIDAPDFIFRTEHGKYQALVKEIKQRHEKGQPVLIGTVSIEKSEKLSRMLEVEGVPHEVLNAKNHEREALIIAQAGRRGAVTVATNMAGRGVDIILGGNPPEKFETEDVRELGGLCVFGTERHEARRIDNQLRGRGGRQGDSGYSQFFVSLDDDLMRIFGTNYARVKNLMESLGVPEDQPLENKIVSKAIEAAQGKIEGFHFDSRKHVLDFDDVLNKQREAIYRMRRNILMEYSEHKADGDSGNRLREQIMEMIEGEVERTIRTHTMSEDTSEWNVREITESIDAIVDSAGIAEDGLQLLIEQSSDMDEKRNAIVETVIERLESLYEGKIQTIGEDGMRNIERAVMLRAIDMLWMDHLDQMEHLRDSVRLRAYGQRDPLVEYKHEGSRLFRELQDAIRVQVVNNIFKIGGMPQEDRPKKIIESHPEIQTFGNKEVAGSIVQKNQMAPLPSAKTVNRNDPCPCGSGKKYKKCHGA